MDIRPTYSCLLDKPWIHAVGQSLPPFTNGSSSSRENIGKVGLGDQVGNIEGQSYKKLTKTWNTGQTKMEPILSQHFINGGITMIKDEPTSQ
ncbi:hypothetical protein CR513_56605, partial [Mucuna pruriens]